MQLKLLGTSQEVIEQMKEHSIPPILGSTCEKKNTHSPSLQILCPIWKTKIHLHPPKNKIEATKRKASSTLRVQLYVSAVMCWGIQLVTSESGETSNMC